MGHRRLAAPAVLAALLVGGASADAQVVHRSFGAIVPGSAQLGVAADGEAVLAWSGTVTTFAAVRPAGAPFGARLRLGTGPAVRGSVLAVGRAGDAVVLWRRAGARGQAVGPVLANVRRPHAVFRFPVAIPGSAGAATLAAAVAPDGTILVAWRRRTTLADARGCGHVVLASLARPGRPFTAARRVSGPCARAAQVRAAMAADGTGAVVWRTGTRVDRRYLQGVPVGHLRFGKVRRVSPGVIAGVEPGVAGGRTGATVAWRDRIDDIPGDAVVGRVLVADLTVKGVGPARTVSLADHVVGPPRVTARPDGSALVAWEEEVVTPLVFAARRAPGSDAFEDPVLLDRCGAADASRTFATPALDARGAAAVVYQSACMGRFGLGTDYGIVLARTSADGAPSGPPTALSAGSYGLDARIGAADDGELVTAWVDSGGLRTAILAP